MAEVKWIKLTTDMFDNRKIKHIRKLPEGNSIVLIWVMLLTLAGRCNSNGIIFLTENIPYTSKMLADELGFEESIIQLALQALEQLGMICSDELGFLAITGWEEHQNIEGMEKIREQNRLRKQKQREKQKLLGDSHVTVTASHATDIEEDIEEDKNRIDKKIICEHAKRFTPPTFDEVEAYVLERNSPVDPQAFIDFYESKGWMVGKNKMKDWKAACRNAEKWDRWEKKTAAQSVSFADLTFDDEVIICDP